jgi:hypothetical protein
MSCEEIEYDGKGFYRRSESRQIFYGEFLRLLCPKSDCSVVTIGILSKDTYKVVIDFDSLLSALKERNNPVRNFVRKYKVFACSEIEELRKYRAGREIDLIFYWND